MRDHDWPVPGSRRRMVRPCAKGSSEPSLNRRPRRNRLCGATAEWSVHAREAPRSLESKIRKTRGNRRAARVVDYDRAERRDGPGALWGRLGFAAISCVPESLHSRSEPATRWRKRRFLARATPRPSMCKERHPATQEPRPKSTESGSSFGFALASGGKCWARASATSSMPRSTPSVNSCRAKYGDISATTRRHSSSPTRS